MMFRKVLGTALLASLAVSAGAGEEIPVLRVLVSPDAGHSPLKVTVRVRQDVEKVRGKVCLVADGPASQLSCWSTDLPDRLVVRTFTLPEGGTYRVYAVSEQERSNQITVNVLEN